MATDNAVNDIMSKLFKNEEDYVKMVGHSVISVAFYTGLVPPDTTKVAAMRSTFINHWATFYVCKNFSKNAVQKPYDINTFADMVQLFESKTKYVGIVPRSEIYEQQTVSIDFRYESEVIENRWIECNIGHGVTCKVEPNFEDRFYTVTVEGYVSNSSLRVAFGHTDLLINRLERWHTAATEGIAQYDELVHSHFQYLRLLQMHMQTIQAMLKTSMGERWQGYEGKNLGGMRLLVPVTPKVHAVFHLVQCAEADIWFNHDYLPALQRITEAMPPLLKAIDAYENIKNSAKPELWSGHMLVTLEPYCTQFAAAYVRIKEIIDGIGIPTKFELTTPFDAQNFSKNM